MRAYIVLITLVALTLGSFADEIRKGATMQVKANSIWFQDSARLTRWQQLKKNGDLKKLKSYEDNALSQRDAWQFVTQLTVKVLRYDPSDQQVNVEMTTPGRLLGTKWFLDAGALVQ